MDAARKFSADVLAVDSPAEVEISRPDNRGRVCGDFGEFCTEACAANDSVAGRADQIGYTRESSQKNAQDNKVVVGYTRDSSQKQGDAQEKRDLGGAA